MKRFVISISCLFLMACSTRPPLEIISTSTDRLSLELPPVEAVIPKDVTFHVITDANKDDKFSLYPVYFALNETGYKNISLNIKQLEKFIIQLQHQLNAYRDFYEK